LDSSLLSLSSGKVSLTEYKSKQIHNATVNSLFCWLSVVRGLRSHAALTTTDLNNLLTLYSLTYDDKNFVTFSELMKATGHGLRNLQNYLTKLQSLGFIDRTGSTTRHHTYHFLLTGKAHALFRLLNTDFKKLAEIHIK